VHPAAWLVWASCGGLVAISTTNPFYLLPLLAAAWAIHAAHGRTDRAAGASFKVFFLFGLAALATRTVLVLFGAVTIGSVAAAALEGLRVAVMLAVYGALSSVTDPFRLLKGAPRRFHEPVLAATLALSIAPRLIAAAGRVRDAQRLRGIAVNGVRAIPALAVPVLTTGMEEAVTLAESMDARGHGRGPRSSYRPERWGAPARIVAGTAVAAACAFLFLGDLLGGGLSPETYPLAWPEVSPGLVAAALAFGLPALLPRDGR
jgi:energy-coupling factor transport system permease protein